MFLLNLETFKLKNFPSDIPSYAILSHRWGDDEISYDDLTTLSFDDLTKKKSWPKLKGFCDAANNLYSHSEHQGDRYGWVDTCCINKSSSAELSESINSMFRWYRNATFCIAFLGDITANQGLPESCWLTRGWTLQELVAPKVVYFYDQDWVFLGTKAELADCICRATGIDECVIKTGEWPGISIASRMKWAAGRKTTRTEDMAYSLLGIFDVNMPLLYGEGSKAFIRLQEEILKQYDDPSIFLWTRPAGNHDALDPASSSHMAWHGILADDPSWFCNTPDHELLGARPMAVVSTNRGMQLTMPLVPMRPGLSNRFLGILPCCPLGQASSYLTIPLVKGVDHPDIYSRAGGCPYSLRISELPADQDVLCARHSILSCPRDSQPRNELRVFCIQLDLIQAGCLEIAAVFPKRRWHEKSREISVSPEEYGAVVVVFEDGDPEWVPVLLGSVAHGIAVFRCHRSGNDRPSCLDGIADNDEILRGEDFVHRFERESPNNLSMQPKEFETSKGKYEAEMKMVSLRHREVAVCEIRGAKQGGTQGLRSPFPVSVVRPVCDCCQAPTVSI